MEPETHGVETRGPGTGSYAAERHARMDPLIKHLGAFLAVGLFFLMINVLTGADDLWFYWPMLPWSVGLFIHAWVTYWDVRALDRQYGQAPTPLRSWSFADKESDPSGAPMAASGDVGALVTEASGLIDRMRLAARQIPNPEARREALEAAAASDQVLSAIADHPDELPLARDFVHRFLQPATSVITEYSRLAGRNVPSARPTLEKVETHDLPLITRRINAVYDRLHRGTLIDLEVAREMLTLEMAGAALPDGEDR